MVCPMAQAASTPSAPTAAVLSYRGQVKGIVFIGQRAATAAALPSTEINSGMSEASCRGRVEGGSLFRVTMFLPEWHTPPTGYFCSASTWRRSARSLPSALASSICSCGRVRSRNPADNEQLADLFFQRQVGGGQGRFPLRATRFGTLVLPRQQAGQPPPGARYSPEQGHSALPPLAAPAGSTQHPASETGQTNHFFLGRYPFLSLLFINTHIPTRGAKRVTSGYKGSRCEKRLPAREPILIIQCSATTSSAAAVSCLGIQQISFTSQQRRPCGRLYLKNNAGCPIAVGQMAQTRGGRAAGIRVVHGIGHQITKPHGQLRAVTKRQHPPSHRASSPVGAVRFRHGDAPLVCISQRVLTIRFTALWSSA